MSAELDVPRIYTSFEEFERDELRRLGLTRWPAKPPVATATAVVPMTATALPVRSVTSAVRAAATPVTRVTPESLRAEGILEIGCARGTSVLFVRTVVKLHILHATWLPDRQLDDYAVNLAVTWIEGHGLPSYQVAKNLGVSETTLRNALTAAGYARLTPAQSESLARARSARKLGNRKGRLVRAKVAAEPRAHA